MILVVGATGLLGGLITEQLLEQGRDTRILVRHDSPAEAMAVQGMATSPQQLIAAGAVPVFGDLKDRASLDEALIGVDTVITTANSVLREGETVETVDCQGNRNLIDAAAAAGIKHFVFISALGADTNSTIPLIRCKAQAESALRESGMAFTILAPDLISEVWVGVVVGAPLQADQSITLVGSANRVHSFVSLGDIASFATACVDNPVAHNAILPVGGPEALSWRNVVDAAGQVLGRDLPVRFVQPGEPIPFVPEAVQQSMAIQDTYDSALPMTELAETYGVKLTPMKTVLGRMFAAH